MVKITYVEFNGTEHVVDVEPGISVMEGAVTHHVPGIVADCGGSMACGTCHIYVDPPWSEKVGEKSDEEADMLQTVLYGQEDSRLSCQIKVSEALDGLVVRMPESQY